MSQRITVLITLIVIITWFLTGNFGATASIFSVRNHSLPLNERFIVKGKEKAQALKAIHEILRNQKQSANR